MDATEVDLSGSDLDNVSSVDRYCIYSVAHVIQILASTVMYWNRGKFDISVTLHN